MCFYENLVLVAEYIPRWFLINTDCDVCCDVFPVPQIDRKRKQVKEQWPGKFYLQSVWEKLAILNTENITRGSAIAEEPRDALRQLKYYGRFLTELLTRSSANPEEPCEHTVSWNRVKCCTNVRRIACENVCNRWMTFKVIQGHCRCHHLIGHILFHISLPL